MADLDYTRILKTQEGAVWGELTVRGVTFVAVENRSKRFASLPGDATYNLRMTTKSSGQPCPCLQFIEVPGRDGHNAPFLIHRAFHDDWLTLAGCIAPGRGMLAAKHQLLLDSVGAMDQILHLLGGWKDGKGNFTIYIRNQAPGDTLSKDEFIAQRKYHQ